MRLGRVGDESVLVARDGDHVYVVGAQCTHYSGPLVEGVLVGPYVRCPLHHACFDLKTGIPVRAPALSPLPCWPVERRDGRIFVGAKRERDPLAPLKGARPAVSPSSAVIIGAGGAGAAAAEMLRREGYDGPVTIIDREPDSPYDRPNLSKDYLAGEAAADWIPLRPPGFYDEHKITIRRAEVAAIDVTKSSVRLADGATVPYGALLLAPGSEPIALDVPGADRPNVHLLRSLADSNAIIKAAEKGRRAVIVGSSFIGLEAAASLRHRGVEVDVVSTEAAPLVRVFGEVLAGVIRGTHEAHGVRFHMKSQVVRIDERAVVLQDGTSLPADFVVVGIGVRPRIGLAQAAGLSLDRGVVVDPELRTSVRNIFAAGDVARWPDPHSGEMIRVEHWVVAERMGQTAARNMLGAVERFAQVPFFWSAHYDLTVNYVGHASAWDRADVSGDLGAGHGSVSYWATSGLLAVATLGEDRESLRAEESLEGMIRTPF
jgi:NADPH-dependent 2,4-dienoyl-CoA reductase/sulfur reductase-like enzyme/nitrite reductase/ring-hydroxylating ferredoxin subunit